MDNLVVGQRVRLKNAMLGEPVGSFGYVYDVYKDFDEEGNGVCIIFMNGGYDGFSKEEQRLYLDSLSVDPRYSLYKFENVFRLSRDYSSGYWKF